MLLIKFHIIWPSGFRGKAVSEIGPKRNEPPTAIKHGRYRFSNLKISEK
jgi:hypothetical protein